MASDAPVMVKSSTHNASVDLWACGIIGYEMIFKKPRVRLSGLQKIEKVQKRMFKSVGQFEGLENPDSSRL